MTFIGELTKPALLNIGNIYLYKYSHVANYKYNKDNSTACNIAGYRNTHAKLAAGIHSFLRIYILAIS